jgi:hypothetical protein
MHGSHL